MDFHRFSTIYNLKSIKRLKKMTLMSIKGSKWYNLIEKDKFYPKVDLF